ncbi:MAG: radical SAM family heme chaperone HemW [Bacteroidales bacterium]|nr:radical SAM family heme chaperone HemW [Bacteroidales bacterium]
MAGIYIHIPYCRQACHYCNFHFSVSRKTRHVFLKALLREIELRKDFFDVSGKNKKASSVKTVYFGGGTPSILPPETLVQVVRKLEEFFMLDSVEEFTLEANPDDLSPGYLESLSQTPVDRLSIGIQSFHKADLNYMNRGHSPAQAMESIENAQKAGFENLSVDLIYGTPTLNDGTWVDNLNRVIAAGVPHVSAYALTVEPKTPLEFFIRKGRVQQVDEEQLAGQFRLLQHLMRERGYLHYEVSNFALPGHLSRHNLAYWQGIPYLGLGPSAHSYGKDQRSWNVANTSAYIASINNNVLPQSIEALTPEQKLNEYLMTSLRTMWGCDLDFVLTEWGGQRAEIILKQAEKFISRGLMHQRESVLFLTDEGKLFADGIAADLFVE